MIAVALEWDSARRSSPPIPPLAVPPFYIKEGENPQTRIEPQHKFLICGIFVSGSVSICLRNSLHFETTIIMV